MEEGIGGVPKVRVVRCPKCDKLLPELPNFTVYRCGGCDATLQAKKQIPVPESSPEKSDGEVANCFENAGRSSEEKAAVSSAASSEVDPGSDRVELRMEEKMLSSNVRVIDSGSVNNSKEKDVLKEPDASTLNVSLEESGLEGRDSRYRRPSKAPLDASNENVDDLVKEKVEEDQEMKPRVQHGDGNHKVRPMKGGRDEERDRASSAYRRGSRPLKESVRPAPESNEGPSDYHQNSTYGHEDGESAKRQKPEGPNMSEYLEQDKAELLRKLDELRDQLRRSCEVSDRPPKERSPAANSYGHRQRSNWFPEGSSSLNRTSSRHSPILNGHGMDIPNIYPTPHGHNGIPAYREAFGSHSLGRAPFHPPAQYAQRPYGNYLYGQFEPDPVISYHHEGFYHQPACSCLHCYNSHWPAPAPVPPPLFSNQRVAYPANNHGFYPVEGSSMFGPQSYNMRDATVPLPSRESRSHQRATFTKKDGRACRPVAGGAPFIMCCNCSELLQLPEDLLRTGKNQHKLQCGSCSQLISFVLDGRRFITSAPAAASHVASENNDNSNDRLKEVKVCHGLVDHPPVMSYSGDYDSPGYEVHSADEKLVLPSFPISSNESVDKEYGTNLSESDKMQGISSSPSMSDGLESPDSMICQRDVPSSVELPFEGEAITRVPSLPLREHFGYPLSNHVTDGSGNGSRSRRSDQEKIVLNGNFKQNSVKDVPVATEMDLSADEYPDGGLSQDSWELSRDDDQPRARTTKGGESFFAGLIKKSFRSMESGRSKVFVNGHPISDRLVKKAEKLAGPVHPGDYWYDYRAGFWGVVGHACLGIIPPFIEEFNFPMPKSCASGNTGVFVNGRELHQKDLALLVGRGLPSTAGRSYIIEISGKVWDEASGEELDSLGKLAPTIEKVKHGFGMRVPRAIA